MKSLVTYVVWSLLLGGCVVVPAGYYRGPGYYDHDHGYYYRGESYHRGYYNYGDHGQ